MPDSTSSKSPTDTSCALSRLKLRLRKQHRMKRRRWLSRIPLQLTFLASTLSAATTIPPATRYGHATVYANNTAYFLGGILSDTSMSSDFFSLDLSQEFNNSSPPYKSLPSLPAATAYAAAAMGIDGRIYLLGGQTWDCSSSMVNVFDPATATWGTPQFFGTTPIRRQGARTFLSTDDEMIFYFGGSSTSCSTGATSVYNTLDGLSLKNSSWFAPANSNPPVAESNFALTKVVVGSGSTQQVLIIGGQTAQQNTYVQMSQLGLFDMGSESWTFVTATTPSGQTAPEERVGHTAVTTSDGKVIVYGGTVGPSNRAAVPQLTILDTSSLPFQWSSPTIGGNVSLSPSAGLTGHSAIMTDNGTMILAFGKDTNGNFNQQAYFLDTQKMEWLSTYTPEASSSSSQSSPDSPSTVSDSPTATNPTAGPPNVAGTLLPTSADSTASAASAKKNTTIAVSTSVPLAVVAIASAAVLIVFLRRRRRNNRERQRTSRQHLLSQTFEMNNITPTSKYLPPRTPHRGHPSTRVFQRIFSRGKAHASPPPRPPPLGVFLPAWAQEHARDGWSSKSASAAGDDDAVEDRMVQVASMSFMAPKMQLRVVNPDQDSLDNTYNDDFRRRVSAGRQV